MTAEDRNALVTRAKAGEQAAWHVVVTEIGPKVKGYALSKGVADADDLVQDVMLAASRNIANFEGSWEDFRSWLFTIAYRRITDTYRRRERLPQLVSIETAAAIGDPAYRPDLRLEAKERLGEAMAALDRLSDIERDVVLLRVVAELDSDAVGAILDKRPGTIRVIQSRAIDKIKQIVRAA